MSNEERVQIPPKPTWAPRSARPTVDTSMFAVVQANPQSAMMVGPATGALPIIDMDNEGEGEAPGGAAPSAVRSSASLALGTMASRILGFLKGIVLSIAIIGSPVADIFEAANYLPNLIFIMIAGGVFNAVLIPQIAKASREADGGTEFISRLLTVGITGLLGLTALVLVLVVPLMGLTMSFTGKNMQLAIIFGLFLLPQIFFYGLYSLLGQVLNAHDSFKAYAWAPVLNNVVAIAGLLVFILVAGSEANSHHTVDNWTLGETAMLAGTATLGIVIQAAALIIPVHRLGLNLRPRFGLKGTGLGSTAKIATWTMGTMIIGNLFFLVILRVATIPTDSDPQSATSNPGILVLNRATELYIMPHSIIALSIATVMFTAMAHAAARNDSSGVRDSLAAALRTTGIATVFAGIALLVLSGPFGMLFSGNQPDVGRQVAITLAILAIGAPFYSINFILNRVFYAQENAKTPFIIQCIMVAIGLCTALYAGSLPHEWIIYGLALSYTISNVAAAVISHFFLRAKIGDYGQGLVMRAHMRYLVAALAAGVAGELLLRLFGSSSSDGFMWQSITASAIVLAVVGTVMAVLYFVILKQMRIPEVDALMNPVLSKVKSRLPGR
ncbi:putative peptidoglycan lipid II flippase [Arthrobacter stackebrandtii]|uniref:Peptidoglycan lipid II flippase n=1 Tax=Arthrobacter stackebrandtii TaxID=272161 RepID=A0ABS4YV87_9MICC|nr:lipid II flippase MurJ [Arthrobacter stackebrandtii]MBP2412713.1 putative peptidoglycan lipid II flippase [Arthrobacter stackebrandtii]